MNGLLQTAGQEMRRHSVARYFEKNCPEMIRGDQNRVFLQRRYAPQQVADTR